MNDTKIIVDCPVLAFDTLGAEIHSMRLHCPEIAKSARPGQFVNLKVGTEFAPMLRRPFSVCRRDRLEGWFEVMWKVIGQGTRAMSRLRPGDSVSVIGPLGRGYIQPADLKLAVLVGGGIGVAALPLLCEDFQQAGIEVEVFLGARNGDELALSGYFKDTGASVVLATEDGSIGTRGLITAPLLERLAALTKPANTHLFSCGPHGFLKAMVQITEETGVAGQIAIETMMGCGFGICVGCAVRCRNPRPDKKKYKLACLDGPVFDAQEIVLDD